VSSTRISRRVNAPRAAVYRALLDARGGDLDGAGLPRGVPAADNEAGWQSSLAKPAALVEAG